MRRTHAALSAATGRWLAATFAGPTAAQVQAWDAIDQGEDTLVIAPTGSGKTLAAFLHAIDRLVAAPPDRAPGCRVLYISPLKALAVDVERNLRTPLAGVRAERDRAGLPTADVTIGLRTGDTSPAERARQARRPPDIWITTPESLYLLLTSNARRALAFVETVIVDEVHALAGTKRGAHLMLSLERLDALTAEPAQRIALSATVAPVDVVADFVRPSRTARHGRAVRVVAPPSDKAWDLQVRVPVEDLTRIDPHATDAHATDAPARVSIWPHVHEQLVDLIGTHDTTLVFANSRGLAERITASINQIAADRGDAALARAHHGSVSRAQRVVIEEDLKAGRLAAVVATSSLELGIDMGSIDLVVQVETPPSVAAGLQRVGRAGHGVGEVSEGIIFPKHRGDLVTSAVAVARMRTGRIEPVRVPRTPLDVLAQQIVAAVAMDDWAVSDLLALARRTASFEHLTDSVFESVLDMLSGRYPSDEFAELRPRLIWDRDEGVLRARPGAQRLAVTSGGTIPDRGLFTVHTGAGPASRVGELDEEMVYESRVGDVIALGASSWRIEEIGHDRVLVRPAPGQPGRLPFWHGDAIGRPADFGAAVGELVRRIATADEPADELADADLDPRAVANLVAYVTEQRTAIGVVPSDTAIVVEAFRDELGDWRVVIHSPFGVRVNAPWSLAIGAALRARTGVDPQLMPADDGIVLRLPDAEDPQSAAAVRAALTVDPGDVERILTEQIGSTALFAARFRECAARALLLPRRRPDRRVPLWQQRQRAGQLLAVASAHGSFPIVLEAVRECLQDVYDVPALREVLRSIRDGTIQVHEVVVEHPSPFARSLVFDYVATYLYEGDAPLPERRARALAVDSGLLAELLGTADLRDLLDATVLAEVEDDLQRRTPSRALRSAEDLADALRELGPLSRSQSTQRGAEPAWIDELVDARRAIWVRLRAGRHLVAIEDAARIRDALGARLPAGLPAALLTPVADPLGDVLRRYARTHGPFPAHEPAQALGLAPAVTVEVLDRLVGEGRLVRGAFWPTGLLTEYVDAEVLRRVRRATIARLRDQIEPVAAHRYAGFLPGWQHVAAVGERPPLHGAEGLLAVVEQLAGAPVPASTWLRSVVPARVAGADAAALEPLLAAGEVVWWGLGELPAGDGLIAVAPADLAAHLRPGRPEDPDDDAARRVLAALSSGGALFFRDLADRLAADGGPGLDNAAVVDLLWGLVWSGHVTNDGWTALRARLARRPAARVSRPSRTRRSFALAPRGPATAAGRWSLVPRGPDASDPSRALAVVRSLVDRAGIVTRAAVGAQAYPGGWAAAYRVLAAMADAGRCQRLYAVDGLGGAQFADPSAVDALRSTVPRGVVALAATDPANAYGAALAWPAPPGPGHRPARVAGSTVLLADGHLVAYLEHGGRSLLVWPAPDEAVAAALAALPALAQWPGSTRQPITRVNGEPVSAYWTQRLLQAGFRATARGPRPPG